MAETFVDREVELDELRRLADSDSAEMALLYGRRRVGKTYLLSRAWEDPFYFLAADTTSRTNLRDLILELARWTGRKLEVDDYPTWRTAFRLMAEVSGERPGEVFVLDEFQYLLQGEEDVASQLTAVWDTELGSSPLLLVLCGSEVATMEALQGSDS
ncbi:MAG: AAA family ATPase, partial [Candidatus Fermentibacterota bacterium]